jgi:hypothetical protein
VTNTIGPVPRPVVRSAKAALPIAMVEPTKIIALRIFANFMIDLNWFVEA